MESKWLVCIYDFAANEIGYPNPLPVKGEIYEFDGIDNRAPAYWQTFIFLKEFTFNNRNGRRIAFNAERFRPVQTMDAEIEFIESTTLKQAELESVEKELTI